MIVMRIEGDGLARMLRQAERIAAGELRREMARALADGGRLTTTAIKRALVAQTSIKKSAIDRRVKGILNSGALEFVILGTGKGVPPADLQSIRGGPRPARSRGGSQPRDGRGRFSFKGSRDEPDFAGSVVASLWGEQRLLWRSWSDPRRGFVYQRPGEPIEHVYGPSVAKEIVKGAARAEFHLGAAKVERKLAERIARIIA